MILANKQRVVLTNMASQYRVGPVSLASLTETILVRIRRPMSFEPLPWDATSTMRITISVNADGQTYQRTGQTTGGIINGHNAEQPFSTFRYTVPYGFFGLRTGMPQRLGERSVSYMGQVDFTWLSGNIDTEATILTSESPAPAIPFRSSVAFDTATSASDTAGDGIISLTHTAGGSDRAVFAGVGVGDNPVATITSTAAYGGTSMTQEFTVPRFIGIGQDYVMSDGFSLVAPATGAQTVFSTVSEGTSYLHALGVISMTGVDQTTPVGAAATNHAISQTAVATVSSVNADDLVLSNLMSFWNGSTPEADQTERWEQTTAVDGTAAGNTQAGSVGGQMLMTQTAAGYTEDWALGAIAFKPVAAAGGEVMGYDKGIGRGIAPGMGF